MTRDELKDLLNHVEPQADIGPIKWWATKARLEAAIAWLEDEDNRMHAIVPDDEDATTEVWVLR